MLCCGFIDGRGVSAIEVHDEISALSTSEQGDITDGGDAWTSTVLHQGDLGMILDFWNVGLMVVCVQEPGEKNTIQKFDFIIGLNNEKGPDNMRIALQRLQAMSVDATPGPPISSTVEVVRPRRLDGIKIKRATLPWGLNLVFQEGRSCCVQIKVICDGAVSEYNKTCRPDMKLRNNDFIVSVDGRTGGMEDLLDAFRLAGTSVELAVLRVPEEFAKAC